MMPLRRMLALALIVVGVGLPQAAQAGIAPAAEDTSARSAPADYLEAREYKITDAPVAGTQGVGAHQTMTAWQVTRGSWQGQALDGLSLVLVQTTSDDSQGAVSTDCYVSYLATPAQRIALVSAFQASLGTPGGQTVERTGTAASWRIEPAVIRLEFMGQRVVVHLGVIA